MGKKTYFQLLPKKIGVEFEINPYDCGVNVEDIPEIIKSNGLKTWGDYHWETSKIAEQAIQPVRLTLDNLIKIADAGYELNAHTEQEGADDPMAGSIHIHIQNNGRGYEYVGWYMNTYQNWVYQKQSHIPLRDAVYNKYNHEGTILENIISVEDRAGVYVQHNLGTIEFRYNESIFPLWLFVLPYFNIWLSDIIYLYKDNKYQIDLTDYDNIFGSVVVEFLADNPLRLSADEIKVFKEYFQQKIDSVEAYLKLKELRNGN